jgi:hypothetical protein
VGDPARTLVTSTIRPLGDISVRRILPALEHRSVGPFVFFDEMGPLTVTPDPDGVFRKLEVRPHPHVGLATLTWLFSGALMHRDSLGSVQVIRPGAVNLMTAGRGIVHSERASQAGLNAGEVLHGAQFWLALPKAHEDFAPAFTHYPVEAIARGVVLGEWEGVRSPVEFPHEALCVDLRGLVRGERITLAPPERYPERAIYVVEGALLVGDEKVEAGTMVVLDQATMLAVAVGHAHALVIGGAPLDGPRYLDWNFVASSKDRLAAARQEWQGYDPVRGTVRFPPVPGETEFIALP